MKKCIITSDVLSESLYEYQLDNGLTLRVFPKKGFSANYAIFGVKFGSVDRAFNISGEHVDLPAGTAHFLEHKMFESEEKDAFERFSKTGASANAYTSFDRTCYLFLCSDGFYDSYDILLDFVQSPYFTDETVLKEQGIIGQEIRMYDDDGEWQSFMNVLRGLYHNDPVNIDIAGTKESIAEITADMLYKCYNAYYNPANMFICISGDVDPDEVASFTESRMRLHEPVTFERDTFDEPELPVQSYISCELDVSKPQFVFAFKETVPTENYSRRCMCAELLLDIIASERSKLYKKLLDMKLVNSSFSAEVSSGRTYFFAAFSGESSDPEAVCREILAEIQRVREEGIDPEAFEASRRHLYSFEIRRFDSVDGSVRAFVNSCVDGYDPFFTLEFFKTVTVEELNALLEDILKEDRTTLSVVLPKKR